ncbi:alpha/beta hydrolase [bacterium]|jgi:uncharacterized protein|nr:alpha/beta hydrolase [bacterium]MBT5345697.1 alpha/beta hydrolase [bacterium]MBT6130654.1 alpha/beta hydrolase [bacterium]MBT6528711.1 alpha/beta hydrolase [bacterium]
MAHRNRKNFLQWLAGRRTLLLGCIIGMVAVVGVFTLYRHFVRPPVRHQESVVFNIRESADSDKVIARKGIFIKRPGARATVLICHGFMCNKHDVSFLRAIFSDYNIFIFDFRAHGELTQGQCCSFGYNEMYDVLGAVDFIRTDRHVGKLPVFAYGFSMGAAAAIMAQEKDPNLFDGLVLDCPFDSSDGIIDRGLNNIKIRFFGHEYFLPGRWILRRYAYSSWVQSILKMIMRTTVKLDTRRINTCVHQISPVKAAQNIARPCLFITCKNDVKAPAHAVKAVYDGVKGYKRLWVTNGRRHFDSFFYNPDRYTGVVQRFIREVLDGKIKRKDVEKIVHDFEEDEMVSIQGTRADPCEQL